MLKSYSLYLLAISLLLSILVGLSFPYFLGMLIEVPKESIASLRLIAIVAGLLLGTINYTVYYFFSLHVINRFREALSRVRSEDYHARVKIMSIGMLGDLIDDVNATLSHLEEKNNEVLRDDLTGLPNRYFLKQHYRKNPDWLASYRTAFLFFDLDKFKEINDEYGHLYGDKVLREVSARVSAALSEDEFLVRLSGDEFLLVANLPEACTGKDLVQQLMALFAEPFDIHGQLQQVQTSIGVSIAPGDGENLAELVRKADAAMYEAKKQDGTSYHVFQKQAKVAVSEMAEPC